MLLDVRQTSATAIHERPWILSAKRLVPVGQMLGSQSLIPQWLRLPRFLLQYVSYLIAIPSADLSKEKAGKSMALPGDLASGNLRYNMASDRLYELRERQIEGHTMNHRRYQETTEALEQRTQLHREIFFLRNRLRTDTPPVTPPQRPKSPEIGSGSTRDNQANPSLPLPPPAEPLKRRQYARYIEESLEREKTGINMTRKMDERMMSQFNEVQADVDELRDLKYTLLRQMRVSTIEDIPDLIPCRRASDMSIRAHLPGHSST